jgi:sarcosine oxidase subunit gamma
MSKAVSALNGKAATGFAQVADKGLCGMITLRGDLGSAPVKKAVKAAVGMDVPASRSITQAGDKAVAWMSPDELLVMVPYADAGTTLAAIIKALGKAHALAVDVSDARAAITVKGAGAAEVLAKVCPVDLSPAMFKQGEMRRTRLAQVAAAIWMSGEGEFTLVCFRSVSEYAFGVLSTSAGKGSEVGYF